MNPMPRISRHARERLASHYECVDNANVYAILARSIPMQQGEAAGMMDRQMGAVLDEYRLAGDRRGIFVIGTGYDNDDRPVKVLITYVRFEASQTRKAWELWPAEVDGRVAA